MEAYTTPQDLERDDFKAAGYRKLQHLKLLKAAAARLISQQEDSQKSALSQRALSLGTASSFSNSSQASSLAPLVRSFSNIEHVMPSQRGSMSLSRSSSTDRPSPGAAALNARAADLPPLVRSNSAGANRMAAYVPSPQVVVQQASTQQRPAAPAAAGHPTWPRAPRYSEPVGGMVGPDDRVELLLTEVESLLAERQKMSARMCALQRDNDQLAELVGRLTCTLQEQELQLQQLQKHQQQLQQQQQHHSGGYLSPVPSLSLPPEVGGQQVTLESPSAAAALQQQHQHQQQHQQMQQQHLLARQVRLDAWLGRRQETWQEWQAAVPLEHMHSGSSSSLTVALDQQ